jgi:predicted nucleic acid-binding protein
MIGSLLRHVQRLYVNTAPLIDYIEEHPAYIRQIDAVFDHVTRAQLRAVCSVLTLMEVLVTPVRIGDQVLISKYRDILLHSQEITCLPITEDIAQTAAELRARFNIRTPDALHLATAIQSNCNAFLTNDSALVRVTAIPIILLSDLDPEETDTDAI